MEIKIIYRPNKGIGILVIKAIIGQRSIALFIYLSFATCNMNKTRKFYIGARS